MPAKKLFFLASLCMLALEFLQVAYARPASADEIQVTTRFVGTTTLEQLVRGEPGSGVILFFSGGPQPALAVRLTNAPKSDAAIAEVYDAASQEVAEPFRIEGNTVVFPSSARPSITMTALGGWWVRDGVINYNLDIQTYGSIFAMWGAGADLGANGWIGQVRPGQPAVTIKVRDPEHEGIPKWDLRLLIPEFPGRGYYRVNYAERKCATPTRISPGVVPAWPFVADTGAYEQEAGVLRPPIVVDWQRATITHFSEMVTVRNQNCSYALYSIAPLQYGGLSRANFETPFAFYDLSAEGRGRPNLILRTERFPAQDPWSTGLDPTVQRGRPAPRDIEIIRYSWRNEVGDWLWDYKIEVLGFHPYTFETPIADGLVTIDAPPYDKFPAWVVEHAWPVVTFVDTEGSDYHSSEGIYDWSPREVSIGYVFGWDTTQNPQAFSNIRQGLRGEYRFQTSLQPRLYFSPIDNRLHLLGAEGGLWNLGDGRVLYLDNLNNGPYIDTWIVKRQKLAEADDSGITEGEPASPAPIEEDPRDGYPGQVEESLTALDEYLIYSGPEIIELRRAAYQLSSFEILPPIDRPTWQAFCEQVEPYTQQKRDPKNLKAWVDAFPGESLRISGAQISNIRATPDGFRFVLQLHPGFQAQGDDLPGVRGLPPGTYAVSYDGAFHVAPLTPPALSATANSTPLTALEQHAVEVRLNNTGLQDVPEATLELWAAQPGSDATMVATQTVSLLSQTPIAVRLPWAPPQAGAWRLTPRLRLPDGTITAFDPVGMAVQPAPAADASALAAVSTWPAHLPLVALVLTACAGLAALVTWRGWPMSPPEEDDDA